MGYPDSSYADEQRLAIKKYLQEEFDGTEIKSFSCKRIYLRGQTTNAPIKLILWLDVHKIPGYDMPCAIVFVLGIANPKDTGRCTEFLNRFKNLFKEPINQNVIKNIEIDFLDDSQ